MNGQTTVATVPDDVDRATTPLMKSLTSDPKDVKQSLTSTVRTTTVNVQQVVRPPCQTVTIRLSKCPAKLALHEAARCRRKGWCPAGVRTSTDHRVCSMSLIGFLPMILIFGVIWFVLRGLGNAANNQSVRRSPRSRTRPSLKQVDHVQGRGRC